MYWEKIKFYNKAFPVANPTENKQHIQGIQILSNRDLYPNTAPLDTVSPNIQGDNCWNKCPKLSSDSFHHHPKLHHSQHISSHHHQQLLFWLVFFLFDFFGCSFSFLFLFEDDGWSSDSEFLSTWSSNIGWPGIIFWPLLLACLTFSAPMPQFSFRMDNTDSLNNGEFISSDSLFDVGECFSTWLRSSGYIPAALNPSIKFLFFKRRVNCASNPIKVYT